VRRFTESTFFDPGSQEPLFGVTSFSITDIPVYGFNQSGDVDAAVIDKASSLQVKGILN
jgi:hypothetical protein